MPNLTFINKSDLKSAQIILIRVDFIKFDLFSAYFIDLLNNLLKQNKKLVIAGSLANKERSLRFIQRKLNKNSEFKVKFTKASILKDIDKIQKKIDKLADQEILLLENLNKYKGERLLSEKLAKNLAVLADLCIIDSFSLFKSYRSSVVLLPLYLRTVYSDSVKYYTQELDKFYKNLFPKESLLLLGGEVDLLRVQALDKVISRFNYILLGSNWSNYFWKKRRGRPSKMRQKVEKWRKKNSAKLVFPLDLIVVRKNKKDKKYQALLIKPNELLKTDTVVDLGPETIRYYALLMRSAEEMVYDQLLSPVQDKSWQNSDLILTRVLANHSRSKVYGVVVGLEVFDLLEKKDLLSMIDLLVDSPEAFYKYLNFKK